MKVRLSIFTLFIFALSFEAAKLNTFGSTVITGTLTITNAANITGTNAESLTINGDVRTLTNAVHNAATQILASTNNAIAGARLVMNLAIYPVTGLQLGGNGSTVITLRTAPDGPLVWTLSTNNWASLTFATNTLGAPVPLGGQEIAGWVQLIAGAVTVGNTNVATNSLVFLTRLSNDGTVATVNEDYAHRTNGASFSILSSTNADTNVIAWKLLTLPSVANLPAPTPPAISYYTVPFAYYWLDEASPPLADATGNGHTLYWTSVGTHTSAAGLFTNCLAFKATYQTNDAAFEFAGGDFAVRFWIQLTNASNSSIIKRVQTSGDYLGWYVQNLSSSGWKIEFGVNDTNVIDSAAITPSGWHRVVAWHQSGVGMGLQIDDNAPSTLAFTDAMGAAPGKSLILLNNTTTQTELLDELVIWKGYIPTSGELTMDWNSGVGKTYPLP